MRLLIIGILFIPFFSFSQKSSLPINKEGKVEYSETVIADSIDAATLYSRAKLCIAENFVDNKAVTQLNDDAAKQIVAKGALKVSCRYLGANHPYGYMRFSITLQAKDSKYRFFISDFVHECHEFKDDASGGAIERDKPRCGGLVMTKKCWNEIKEQTDQTITSLIEVLKDYMLGKAKTTKDTW